MKNNLTRTILALVLLLAVMAGATLGVNAITAPIVEANRKALLGDSEVLFDRADPDAAQLTVTADTVQSVLRDGGKQVYTLHLSTFEGYTKDKPIELTLVVDFEGRIVSLSVDSSGETRELSEDFLPGFTGQDSTLAGVQLVAGVTFSSTAIKNAVNDGFNTLIDNGLFAAAEKSAEQLLRELLPTVYPELVSGSGAINGVEAEGSGSLKSGYQSSTGDGYAWFVNDGSADYLGIWTVAEGAKLYDTAGEPVDNAALLEEIETWSLACRKALLGDAVALFDRNDASVESELEIHGETVQSIYKNDTDKVYTLHLSTNQGYTKDTPIELTLVVDYEGKIVSVSVDRSGETKELDEGFLPSFTGQDSTMAGVELVAGVTFSSTAIKNAVNDGFDALITNGLVAGAQKSDEQLLQELVPIAYPGIVNKAGAIQGEELAASGSASSGVAAANGSGCLWYVDSGEKLLAVYTHVGGVTLYNTLGEVVTESADPALIEEIQSISIEAIGERDTKAPKAVLRLLPEGAEPVAAEIPGLTSCVVNAWTAETEEGSLYVFHMLPYGYANEVMDLYLVLDESGAITGLRTKELILHSEYFSDYTLDEASYKEGLMGLTADSYTGEQTLIAGATMSSDAMESAMRAAFEAFWLLTENRG